MVVLSPMEHRFHGSILCLLDIDAQVEVFLLALYTFIILCGGAFNISNKELQINEEIRDKELRLIDSDGTQLGVVSIGKALDLASEKNLDLVKIAPQANPVVCKIMDYGKYRFEQAKREKEAKKNQRIMDLKEIRLSLNIDTHDFNTKLKHASRFIGDGNKVKVSIRFRGREMGHPEL